MSTSAAAQPVGLPCASRLDHPARLTQRSPPGVRNSILHLERRVGFERLLNRLEHPRVVVGVNDAYEVADRRRAAIVGDHFAEDGDEVAVARQQIGADVPVVRADLGRLERASMRRRASANAEPSSPWAGA